MVDAALMLSKPLQTIGERGKKRMKVFLKQIQSPMEGLLRRQCGKPRSPIVSPKVADVPFFETTV